VTCRELNGFIDDYLSGALPADVREQFEHHLTLCSNCTAYLANYRATIRLGKRVFADDDAPVPGDVPDDLVKAILAARRR
jgi:anti-sigma factor RsiW